MSADHRAQPEQEISASEALYAFAAWLTCMDSSITFGSRHVATQAADLVQAFSQSQGLAEPRENWSDLLKPYPGAPAAQPQAGRGRTLTNEQIERHTLAAADELARALADLTTYRPTNAGPLPGMIRGGAYVLLSDVIETISAYRPRPAPETAGEAVAVVRYMTTGGNVGIAWRAVPTDSAPLLPEGTKLYTAPAPAQWMSEEQERAGFEQWAKDDDRLFLQRADDGYEFVYTNEAWVAWKARAAWGVKLEGGEA